MPFWQNSKDLFLYIINKKIRYLVYLRSYYLGASKLKSCTWKHGCQNHNYVQGGQGVQY